MKKYFTALSATALISAAPFALAASSTDMTVTGTITPSACLPTLSGNGIVDYGKISSKDLNQNTSTPLESRLLSLSVSCDGAMPFALRGIDNRANSTTFNNTFGLGKINGTQDIGRYMLGLGNAIADGVPVQPISSADGQNDWARELFWKPGNYVSVAANDDFSQPIRVQDFSVELLVGPFINRADGLDLTSEVSIDGLATLEMNYL